jgi:hypothetical protein
MRGAANLSPVDTPRLHEECHSVNAQIRDFAGEFCSPDDPAITQTRQAQPVRLHLCSFPDSARGADLPRTGIGIFLRNESLRRCAMASSCLNGQTTLSLAANRHAFLLLFESAPVDAEVAHLVIHDASRRAEQARRLRAIAAGSLERVLDQVLLVRVERVLQRQAHRRT